MAGGLKAWLMARAVSRSKLVEGEPLSTVEHHVNEGKFIVEGGGIPKVR